MNESGVGGVFIDSPCRIGSQINALFANTVSGW